MERTDVIQLRVSPEEKREIEARAIGMDMSKYLRLRALGLPVAHSETTPQERTILSTKNVKHGEQGSIEVDIGEIVDPRLPKLVKQLEAQGKSPSQATSLARKRLGLTD